MGRRVEGWCVKSEWKPGIRKQTGEMVGNSNIIGIGYGTADENGY